MGLLKDESPFIEAKLQFWGIKNRAKTGYFRQLIVSLPKDRDANPESVLLKDNTQAL